MELIKKSILTFSLLAAVSTSIYAEETPKISGFYIGVGGGSFSYDTEQDWDDNSQNGQLVQKTSGNTLKVYGGYQFNRIVGVEATYTDYGDTEGQVYDFWGTTLQSVKQSPTSFAIAANLGYTFDNGLRPFGIVGLSKTSLNSSYEFLDTDSPIAIKVGFGLGYSPAQLGGVQLRIAYEMENYFAEAYNGYSYSDEADIDIFTLSSLYAGISYKF